MNTIQGKRILIVEDDEFSFEYLDIVLNTMGVNTLRAVNGKEAVELCHEHSDLDLILMDIHMPIMNGYDSTIAIRNFNKEIPIIAQTAFVMKEDQEKIKHSGFNEFIAKPINKNELFQLLTKFIE